MADDAGFAAAITIRQNVLNKGILVAYSGGSFPRSFDFDVPTISSSDPAAHITFFLAPPQITCTTDTLSVTLQMWGTLAVTMTDVQETGNVAANLTLRIQPEFVVRDSSLVLIFDDPATEITATEWDFTVISGSGYSAGADSYLRGAGFISRMQSLIQDAVLFGKVQLPSVDISFLGDGILSAVVDTHAQSRVVSGALLLGLDVHDAHVVGEKQPVTTTGDVTKLADFARDNDIAAVTSAVAVPILLQMVQSEVSDQVSQNGATLEALQITPQTGSFHVDGSASNWEGSAAFSFDVIPGLYASTPGAFFQYVPKYVKVNPRIWPALVFTTANVQVSADPALWLAIGSFILGGINPLIPVIVFNMADSVAASLHATIASNADVIQPRVQHLKSSTPGVPVVRIEVAEFDITADGTFIGIKVQPQEPPGVLIGLTSIPVDFATEALGYTIRLPVGVTAEDPNLRIRWTVIDPSGNVLVSEDSVIAGNEAFSLTPQIVAPGLTQLGIGVRVYRALGAQITDFVNDNIKLSIGGPLAPGAYVRWFYDVKNSQVAFDSKNNVWNYAGQLVVKRHSNLHRTDKPCANASKRSRYKYLVQTLDALPFPLANIEIHRTQLCDYCFYGGPAGIRPSL